MDELWEVFFTTGKISDYLKYKFQNSREDL